MPHVRICAGGGGRPPSLPRHNAVLPSRGVVKNLTGSTGSCSTFPVRGGATMTVRAFLRKRWRTESAAHLERGTPGTGTRNQRTTAF